MIEKCDLKKLIGIDNRKDGINIHMSYTFCKKSSYFFGVFAIDFPGASINMTKYLRLWAEDPAPLRWINDGGNATIWKIISIKETGLYKKSGNILKIIELSQKEEVLI